MQVVQPAAVQGPCAFATLVLLSSADQASMGKSAMNAGAGKRKDRTGLRKPVAHALSFDLAVMEASCHLLDNHGLRRQECKAPF